MIFVLLALRAARPPSRGPPRGLRDRTPAPPPPSYAVAPSVLLRAGSFLPNPSDLCPALIFDQKTTYTHFGDGTELVAHRVVRACV